MADPEFDALRRRLSAHGVDDVRPVTGGASSLTYRALSAGRPVIVKVAPAGRPPVGHRDVLRQARMIQALKATDVPVPELLLSDPGQPPDVPPLYVMSLIDGESFEPLFDPPSGARDDAVRQRYFAAARVMAELHRLDPASLGIDDEQALGASAEIDRWSASLETVDPALAPGWRDVRDALSAAVPADIPPAVVHGDFRLGNLLAQGEAIAAVIDWEIWSIGDPRLDMGWFLINSDPGTYGRATPYADIVPVVGDLARCYVDAAGRDVPDLEWFMALACFKSTATWSLIVKHNRRSAAPRPEIDAMAHVLPRLLQRAVSLLG